MRRASAVLAGILLLSCTQGTSDPEQPSTLPIVPGRPGTTQPPPADDGDAHDVEVAVPTDWPDQVTLGFRPEVGDAGSAVLRQLADMLAQAVGVAVVPAARNDEDALVGGPGGSADIAIVDALAVRDLAATAQLQVVRDEAAHAGLEWISFDGQPLCPGPTAVEVGRSVCETGDSDAGGHDEQAVRPRGLDTDRLAVAAEAITVSGSVVILGTANQQQYAMAALHQMLSDEVMAALEVTVARSWAELARAIDERPDTIAAVGDLDGLVSGASIDPDDHQLLVVGVGPSIPNEVVVIAQDLPAELVRALRDALLDIAESPVGAHLLLDLGGIEGLVPVDPAVIDVVHDVARLVEHGRHVG